MIDMIPQDKNCGINWFEDSSKNCEARQGAFTPVLGTAYCLEAWAVEVIRGRQLQNVSVAQIEETLKRFNPEMEQNPDGVFTTAFLGTKFSDFSLYRDVTSLVNDKLTEALSSVEEGDIAEFIVKSYPNIGFATHFSMVGAWDYKNTIEPFTGMDTNNVSRFFYYQGRNGVPYNMGYEGRITGLLEFDDPGNINFGVVGKKVLTVQNKLKLLIDAADDFNSLYKLYEENRKKLFAILGITSIDAINPKILELLDRDTPALKLAPRGWPLEERFLILIRSELERWGTFIPDDPKDRAAYLWAYHT